MVTGTSIAYVAGSDAVDIPRPPAAGPLNTAHRPWCVDCKVKHDADQLDDASRCSRCARAAVTRAAAAARRATAEETARLAELERKHQAKAGAKKPRTPDPAPRPTPRATPSKPLGQELAELERTPPAVAAASAALDNVAAVISRTPDPGELVARATAEETSPAQLLAQTEHHPSPAVQILRRSALGALEALALIAHQLPVGATTPAPAGHQTSAAGAGKGKPTPAADTPARGHGGPPRIQLPVDDVIAAYQAGQTLDQIAVQHGVSAPTIRRCLVDHDVERRRAPVEHTPELIEQVRHLYQDEQLSQVEIAQQLGRSSKVVQSVMERAGIARRPAKARRGADTARALKARIAELGVPTKEIRAWARAQDLEVPDVGILPARVVDAYARAHQQEAS